MERRWMCASVPSTIKTHQPQLTCTVRAIALCWTLVPNFELYMKLSVAGVKLRMPQRHGVCSFSHWVTRKPWHNTHFNCLLLFIYSVCFIDIITVLEWGNESQIICFVQYSFSAVWLNEDTLHLFNMAFRCEKYFVLVFSHDHNPSERVLGPVSKKLACLPKSDVNFKDFL